MNTKAQAASTNAPAAKDDNKNANAGNTKAANSAKNNDDETIALAEKAANMSMEQRKALALSVLEGEATAEEQKLFGIIQAENTKANTARNEHTTAIEAAVKALAGTNRPFSANDMKKLIDNSLISKEVIAEVAQQLNLIKGSQGQANGSERTRKESTPKVFASSSNPVFIKIPRLETDHKRTSDVIIHQGRANEYYQGKKIFGPLSKPLARIKGKDEKETEAKLMEYVVDKAYAKTEAGQAELKKIAGEIFANKE